MDAATILIGTTMDVAAGFGLLSFYSSVADVATMEVVSVLVVDADATTITATMAVNGLSSFLFSSLAVEITALAANFQSQASFPRRLLTYHKKEVFFI